MFNNHFKGIVAKTIGLPPSCIKNLPNDNFKKNSSIRNEEELKHIQEALFK